MAPELRLLTGDEDEIREWFRSMNAGFGGMFDEGRMQDERTVLPLDRMIGVFDGARCVATAASYPFELTLPGGETVPAAGLAGVTVAATHRRRGLLREVMREFHRDVRARGEVAGLLTASETHIYDRFGYGPATSFVQWEMETGGAGFRTDADSAGTLDEVPKAEAGEPLTTAYERIRRLHAGSLNRTEAWWELMLADRPSWKGGGDLFVVVHRDGSGLPDGYVTYKVEPKAEQWINRWKVEVTELLGVDPQVEAALWRHVLDLDLVHQVRAKLGPVNDPLRWRLAEPRQLRMHGPIDLLWICPFDVCAVLEARSYWADGSVTLETTGGLDGSGAGTWQFAVADGAGSCEPAAGDPDLVFGIDSLGAVLLGGVHVATLAAAGRIDERRAGTVDRLTRMLATPRAPFCSTLF